mgnify:CR=1 FL=1|jgi:hypothetical protein
MTCLRILLILFIYISKNERCVSQVQLFLSSGIEQSLIKENPNVWGYRVIETIDYSPLVRLGVGFSLSKFIALKWQIQGSFKTVKVEDRGFNPLKEIVFNKYTYSILTTVTITNYLHASLGPFLYDIPVIKQVVWSKEGKKMEYDGTLFGLIGSMEAIYKNFTFNLSYEFPIESLTPTEFWTRDFMNPINSFQITLGYTFHLQKKRTG